MNFKIVAALVSTVMVVGVQTPAQARGAHHAFRHHGNHASVRHHGRVRHHGYSPHRAERGHGGGGLLGMATWYGPGFQGHRTANGERFNAEGLTAAHRSLPLGCRVLVTNHANGRSVVVRINDRGPYARGKIIDLSHASARAIGMSGSALVTLSRM